MPTNCCLRLIYHAVFLINVLDSSEFWMMIIVIGGRINVGGTGYHLPRSLQRQWGSATAGWWISIGAIIVFVISVLAVHRSRVVTVPHDTRNIEPMPEEAGDLRDLIVATFCWISQCSMLNKDGDRKQIAPKRDLAPRWPFFYCHWGQRKNQLDESDNLCQKSTTIAC